MSTFSDEAFDDLIEERIEKLLNDHLGKELFRPGFVRLENIFLNFKQIFKQKHIKIITIAGTNGKGETAHALAYLLRQEELQVALFTSPHVLSITERFNFNTGNISYPALELLFKAALDEIQGNILSYYEFMLYSFCYYIAKAQTMDIIILEVGLGGRLDATNQFDADICGLTSISKDHTELLGNTLSKILVEKMGILRSNVPCISALEQADLNQQLGEYCRQRAVPLKLLSFANNDFKALDYTLRNQQLALELAAELLKRKTHTKLSFPMTKGRSEKMTIGNISFIFIGAHNEDGLLKMLQKQKIETSKGLNISQMIIAFSKRSDEEIKSMLDLLLRYKKYINKVNLTTFEHEKSFSAVKLEKICAEINGVNSINFNYEKKFKAILTKIYNKKQKENILVTGSYYFIGTFQKELFKWRKSHVLH